jgi:hypothetical protein
MSKHTYLKTPILIAALFAQNLFIEVSANQGIRIKDIHFEQFQATNSGDLQLKGAGILTWGVWIDLYAAAFYTSQDSEQHNRRLVIHYFVPIKAVKIREVAESFILKQQGQERLDTIRPSLDRLHNAMSDVEPGDRYALTLTAQGELILEFNEQRVITLTDRKLAEAYLDIWLGSDPIDPELRLSLIGK